MHQLGDKIEERELGVCDAVFRAAQDMSVDNGLLDAMEENFRLPALGTMTCCIRGEKSQGESLCKHLEIASNRFRAILEKTHS